MEDNVHQRIKDIIENEKLSSSAFSNVTGIPRTTITNMFHKGTYPSFEFIRRISDVFPKYSLEWLITGKGEMLKPLLSFPQPEVQVVHHPKSVEKIVDEQYVTLYDVDAAANLKTLFDNKSQHILGEIKIPNMPKCDGAVYVRGDSMYPLLKSGDIIIYKEIKDFQNVIFGEMYLVSFDMGDEEFLAVKYVNKSEEEGKIKLVSYNQHHQPKDINIEEVRAMALVKVSIRINTMK